MDFRDNADEGAFRSEVRKFLAEEYAGDGDGSATSAYQAASQGGQAAMARYQQWMKKLATKGWVAPAWPKEYGGAGMTIMEQFIFNEELAQARAPRPGGIGIAMAGPTIIVYGSDEQKQEHLSGMLSADVVWCQGFSEPGSGSDLASLQTRAVQDGDDYVVNGQKIWTTGAQYADRMILLARTDPEAPKHKGISYFLLDMKSPGVSVRPLVNMAGTPGFNEVFFDNVRVPRKDLLGEENRGWYVGDDDARLRAVIDRDVDRAGAVGGGPDRLGEAAQGRPPAPDGAARAGRARHRGQRGAADVVPGDLDAEPRPRAEPRGLRGQDLRRGAEPADHEHVDQGGGAVRAGGARRQGGRAGSDEPLRAEQGPLRADVPAGGGVDDCGRDERGAAQHDHRHSRPRLAARLAVAAGLAHPFPA